MKYTKGDWLPLDIVLPSKWYDSTRYKLREEITFFKVNIPIGYVTDGATIPRWLTLAGLIMCIILLVFDWYWMATIFGLVAIVPVLFPHDGNYLMAAILHDWLLEDKSKPRKEADVQFYNALVFLDIKKWRAKAMYFVVRFYSTIKDLQNA